MIEREIEYQQAGHGGKLIFKMNALVDPQMIQLLYKASQAGVQVDLLIRGMCSLRPGVEGLSENITVKSVVGRFLEHSRLYYARNGGNEQLYVGSADLMERNLDRRVEVLFPIEDQAMLAYLRDDVLGISWRDTAQARILLPDGSQYCQLPKPGEDLFDSQAEFLRRHMAG